MLLPNPDRAFIDPHKLAKYCLDPEHPVGRHKAVLFRRVLGLKADDTDLLRGWLLRAVLVHDAEPGQLDQFGQRYAVDFPVGTAVGSAMLRSAWMVRVGEDFPRLTTCFVLPD